MHALFFLLVALTLLLLFAWARHKFKKQGAKIMALQDTVSGLEQARDAILQDVANVRAAVGTLKTNVAELTRIVAELQANQPAPELEARIQAVSASLNAVDTELDEIAPDPEPPSEPV